MGLFCYNTHMKQFQNKNSGFTLFELTIVIIIIVVLGSMLFIIWPGKKPLVTAQALQIAQDLRYARHYAITQETSTRITFNTSTKQYTLINNATSAAILLPGKTQSTEQLDTSFTLTLTNLPNSYIIFDKDGVPYTDNSGTVLTLNATVALTEGSETGNITIRAHSGSINLPNY